LITVVLIVSRVSGWVEFIAMPIQGFITMALPGSFKGRGVSADYWDGCYEEDLDPYLTENYEFWIYNTDFEDGDSQTGLDFDSDDDLSWEFTPVQMFAKGEPIGREYFEPRSKFIGMGNEFSFSDVQAEFPDQLPKPAPRLERVDRSVIHRVCPWCGITAVRRYNFHRENFFEIAEEPFEEEMENPVVWTDGAWSDGGYDEDSTAVLGNQYGDCVICCPACQALFLASEVEPRSGGDDASQKSVEHFVAPGGYSQGYFRGSLSEEWILTAQLDQSIDYLEQSLATGNLIEWSHWTAAQQVVNFISHHIRIGGTLPSDQDEKARALIQDVVLRTRQLYEGTLGSMYSRNNVLEESQEENFWEHTFALEENLPLANMRRIAGDWHEIELTLGENYTGIENLQGLERSGWSELDQYILRRRLFLRDLIATKDSRWALHSGEIQTRTN